MDLIAEIKALLARRAGHLAEIEQIDRQLVQVQNALGFARATPMETPRPVPIRHQTHQRAPWAMGGLTQRQIVEALARREPQSASELQSVIGARTVRLHLAAMARAGQIVRRKGTQYLPRGAAPYLYARTDAAFGSDASDDATGSEAVAAVEAEAG